MLYPNLFPITNPADPDVLMLGVTHGEISKLYVNYILVNKKRGGSYIRSDLHDFLYMLLNKA